MNPDDFWYPWYPGLYANHAIGLTLEQDAIYRRLIDRYMLRREPLPSYGQAVANICMISLDKWSEHSLEILKFFTEKDGLLHHKKCDIELNRQDSYSKRMSENARKANAKRNINQSLARGGFAAAAIQDKDKIDSYSNEYELPPITPPKKTEIENDKPKRARRGTTFCSETFEPDFKSIGLAAKLNIPIESEKRKFIDYWLANGKQKADWQATFRNWITRAAEYRQEREKRNLDGRQSVRDVTGAALRAVAARRQSLDET